MMTTQIEQTPKEHVSYEENILNFLEYTILLLSQVSSADEADIIMDDFLSDDFIDILVENKELFSILGIVWLDVFKRVFIFSNESSFSLKTLWIPVLFHKLDWSIEHNATLIELHSACENKIKDDNSLYNHLVLLFIEGMYFSLEQGIDNFKSSVKNLATSDEDIESINRLFDDLASLGWPQNTNSNQKKDLMASHPSTWDCAANCH